MNKLNNIMVLCIGIAAIFCCSASPEFSQDSRPPSPGVVWSGPSGHPPIAPVIAGGDSERSMKVDPGLNLKLCVTQGNVKINGWNRSELRVFVQDGSKFNFKVLQTDQRTQDPVWVAVVGIEGKSKFPAQTDCISGGDIEIDVPLNSTVNFKGEETTTTIDTLRKVDVRTSGGDISLRNVSGGVLAKTFEGNLSAEQCKGAMSLDATAGNIVVFDAGPSEIGDIFSAKTTSGAISLQNLSYRQIEANSISGSVAFSGEILSGGTYNLTTSIGSIRILIPQNSACTVSATYGYGRFNSDLPFKLLTETISEGNVKNIVGAFGADGGNSTLKLTTSNGSISIRKL